MKEVVETLKSAISQKNEKDALSILQSGILVGGEFFLELARSKGAFRYSNYNFETKIILKLVEIILNPSTLVLSQNTRVYFESVRSLSFIAEKVRSSFNQVKKAINTRSFKTYLVTLDTLFLNNHIPKIDGPRSNSSHFSKEELASAFSYYYSLLHEKSPPTDSDLIFIIEEKIRSNYYLDILTSLAKTIRFKEAEFLVEVFGYQAQLQGTVLDIIPTDNRFEISVRWGYVYTEEQQRAGIIELRSNEIASLSESAKMLTREVADRIFEIKHICL